MTHEMLLTPRSPSQTSLRELATPGEPAEAIIMVLVCIHAFTNGETRTQRVGALGQQSHSHPNSGARALLATLACHLGPFLSIHHPPCSKERTQRSNCRKQRVLTHIGKLGGNEAGH